MDHFGIDLHQKHSEICGLDGEGRVNYQKRVTTSEASFRRVFGKRKASRVVIESGCQTAWAARLLQEMGHEVVVVNPRRVRLIALGKMFHPNRERPECYRPRRCC